MAANSKIHNQHKAQ